MYQTCPICNGAGVVPSITTSSPHSQCTVCKGAKIISEVTGLPPGWAGSSKAVYGPKPHTAQVDKALEDAFIAELRKQGYFDEETKKEESHD